MTTADGGAMPDSNGASMVCVGTGSCAGFSDQECTSAALLGLSCARTTGDTCEFSRLGIGQPSDPGCAAETTANDCVGLSVGCGWDGAACSFKQCHLQEAEGDCQARGCVWESDDCYYTDCTQLDTARCQGTFGCISVMNAFVACTGAYSCDELDVSQAPPSTTPQQLCEAAAMTGLPCSWAP